MKCLASDSCWNCKPTTPANALCPLESRNNAWAAVTSTDVFFPV